MNRFRSPIIEHEKKLRAIRLKKMTEKQIKYTPKIFYAYAGDATIYDGECDLFLTGSPQEAEFVARACNSYEELLEALKGVRIHKCMFDSNADFNRACDAVNAAIAKAEGR